MGTYLECLNYAFDHRTSSDGLVQVDWRTGWPMNTVTRWHLITLYLWGGAPELVKKQHASLFAGLCSSSASNGPVRASPRPRRATDPTWPAYLACLARLALDRVGSWTVELFVACLFACGTWGRAANHKPKKAGGVGGLRFSQGWRPQRRPAATAAPQQLLQVAPQPRLDRPRCQALGEVQQAVIWPVESAQIDGGPAHRQSLLRSLQHQEQDMHHTPALWPIAVHDDGLARSSTAVWTCAHPHCRAEPIAPPGLASWPCSRHGGGPRRRPCLCPAVQCVLWYVPS